MRRKIPAPSSLAASMAAIVTMSIVISMSLFISTTMMAPTAVNALSVSKVGSMRAVPGHYGLAPSSLSSSPITSSSLTFQRRNARAFAGDNSFTTQLMSSMSQDSSSDHSDPFTSASNSHGKRRNIIRAKVKKTLLNLSHKLQSIKKSGIQKGAIEKEFNNHGHGIFDAAYDIQWEFQRW